MNAWWIGTVSTVIGTVTGALLQAWRERVAHRRQLAEIATTATGAFESVHEKSHLITLLTGDRDHPVRAAAREMRQALLPLCQEVQGRTPLPAERVDDLVRAVQRELRR